MLIAQICPICKKRFYPTAQHVYKKAGSKRKVCSWNCVIESEKIYKAKLEQKQKGEKNESTYSPDIQAKTCRA